MKIFINDIPVYILSEKKINMNRAYGLIVREFESIVPEALVDDVLIMNATYEQVDSLLKLMTGLPFWMDEHNVEWHCSKRYGHKFWWLIFLLEGFILKLADHVTCVSEADRGRLISCYRLNPERVVVSRTLKPINTGPQEDFWKLGDEIIHAYKTHSSLPKAINFS